MTALAGSQALVLRAIIAAADRGDVCPTNTELGDLIAGGAAVACAAMLALQKKGLVKVQRFARSRQVTIVATGATTRQAGNTAPHWRAVAGGIAAHEQAES